MPTKTTPKSETPTQGAHAEPVFTTLPIDDIRPYWRNPRKINETAIVRLADVIRDYGYKQPIVVDAKHTVIIGHRRLAAVRRLGWTNVPVIVADDLSPAKARELRVLDNKIPEDTDWDLENLTLELREFGDTQVLTDYFADVDLSIKFGKDYEPVTADDVKEAIARVSPNGEPAPVTPTGSTTSDVTTETTTSSSTATTTDSTVGNSKTRSVISLTCPHCFKSFEVDPGTVA